MTKYIKGKKFILVDQVYETEQYLVINEEGRFAGFVDDAPSQEILDFSDYLIAPGIIDTHIHGFKGYDIMDAQVEGLLNMSKNLLTVGTTRFMPTTLTAPKYELEAACQSIAQVDELGWPGAKSVGIFLEGPFFTEKYKGAQNAQYFRDPSVEEINHLQQLAKGAIKKVSLAPERANVIPFIEEMRCQNINVAIGHTDATYDQCQQAIQSGANIFIHLYNGMRGLHHREPGVVGAFFDSENTFAELIVDGHHVNPHVVNLTTTLKTNQICLITDCMRAGNMPDGDTLLGELPVTVKDGIARTQEGALAGSTLILLDGIKNMLKYTKLPLFEIWKMASLHPAQSINIDHDFGSIEEHKIADLLVVNEQDLSIKYVMIEGNLIN